MEEYFTFFAKKMQLWRQIMVFLHPAEQYAAVMGKQYFRLDCAVDNVFLNSHYDAKVTWLWVHASMDCIAGC